MTGSQPLLPAGRDHDTGHAHCIVERGLQPVRKQ
jgi:hypothetical protein